MRRSSSFALDGLRSLHPMCFLDRAKVLRCGFFGGAPDDQYGNETLFGDPAFTLKSERSGVLDHDQRWASCSLLESDRKREVECSTPEQPKLFVPKLRRPFAIALEHDLACAAEERGPISCWNLRDETTFDVPGLSDGIDLQSDGNQFCALLRSGDVHCWAPEYGANPKQLALSGLVRFAGNRFRACGIQANRQLTCIEAKSGEMSIIDPIPDVVELVAGADHHCLRTADERMTCFGSNQFGQLGALPPNIWLTPRMIE